jgi:alpha-galactosidase
MVDADSEEAQSPQRFIKMAEELKKTGREIDYYLCQWGIGENVPQW